MYSTSLLSWTTSRALLTNLTILQTFWLFLGNLTLLVSMFFIRFIPPEATGRWSFHRQKSLAFFLALCKPHQWLKFYLLTVIDTRTSTYHTGYIYTYEYIPHRDLWLNRLYFEISNSSKKQCLAIYMRHVNDIGPAKFRTGAENDKEQICCYNYNKKDRTFNPFLVVGKQTSTDAIIFSIVNLDRLIK